MVAAMATRRRRTGTDQDRTRIGQIAVERVRGPGFRRRLNPGYWGFLAGSGARLRVLW